MRFHHHFKPPECLNRVKGDPVRSIIRHKDIKKTFCPFLVRRQNGTLAPFVQSNAFWLRIPNDEKLQKNWLLFVFRRLNDFFRLFCLSTIWNIFWLEERLFFRFGFLLKFQLNLESISAGAPLKMAYSEHTLNRQRSIWIFVRCSLCANQPTIEWHWTEWAVRQVKPYTNTKIMEFFAQSEAKWIAQQMVRLVNGNYDWSQ